MKCILILTLLIFAGGCNSSSSKKAGGTSMQGTWTVTGNVSGSQSGSGTYQVALVSSPCKVTTPVGTFSVQGPSCFIANNNSGQGSISGGTFSGNEFRTSLQRPDFMFGVGASFERSLMSPGFSTSKA